MQESRLHPLPLTLSIIALALSIYSVYAADGFDFLSADTSKALEDEGADETVDMAYGSEFKDEVYSVIDQYITEKSGQAPNATPPTPANVDMEVLVDDDPIMGDPDAPVTIVEFSDYQCPFCERYFLETLPQITQNYIETGKVNYVFRDFPLYSIHSNAAPAANAAECLRDQTDDQTYFEYHDLLFNNQATLKAEDLKRLAADFDIDQDEFASCVDNGDFMDEVDADFQDGQTYGISGTPGFFINGRFIEGAQKYSLFEQTIEAALEEAK